MERIYLDYAATTPVLPEVERAMRPYFSGKFGNPNSIHLFGQEGQRAIDAARESIARAIGAPPAGGFRELLFTGSATEANNLVLRGVIAEIKRRGVTMERPRVLVSAIEHESVLETCRALEREGVEVVCLSVDKKGMVNLKELEAALTPQTALVSIMYANNEIGTIQPLGKIGKMIAHFRAARKSVFPLFHTDAVQAFQFLPCDVKELGLDFMTLSAHKIYGPKGIGVLFARNEEQGAHRGIFLSPQITGGSQEFGLRSGTQNVPYIAGFQKAVEIVSASREKETKRILTLRGALWSGIKKNAPGAALNHSLAHSLPHILNVYFPRHDAHEFVIHCDLQGVAISAGSACGTRMLKTSHVLKAIGLKSERANCSVRFSLGRQTTPQEIAAAVKAVRRVLGR